MPTQSEGESVSRRVRRPTILRGLGVVSPHRHEQGGMVVDHASLGAKARGLALAGLALHEIADDGSLGPGAIVEVAIQPDGGRLGGLHSGHAPGAGSNACARPPASRRKRNRSEEDNQDRGPQV